MTLRSIAAIAAASVLAAPLLARAADAPFTVTAADIAAPAATQSAAPAATESATPAAAAAPAAPAGAAPEDSDRAALAKKLANPVANLISVPFQNNYACCYGPAGGGQYLLNIQPVIPISISRDWNLILRTIVPVINQGVSYPGTSNDFGFGDVTQSFFFSPKKPVGGMIIGVGPAFVYPLGNSSLGSQEWSVGPTFVVLKQTGRWTTGMLANWVWSFAGPNGRPPVNQTYLQPFLVYTTAKATSFVVNTETTLDWTGRGWTVPINFDVGQVLKLGNQLIQIQAGPKVYVTSPNGGPGWGARLNLTLLFPKR